MNIPLHLPKRTSPVEPFLRSISGTWQHVHNMPTLVEADRAIDDHSLAIADFSCFPQWGVKGTGAKNWLNQYGIAIPKHPNTWCSLPNPEKGIVAQLGVTEFAIQTGLSSLMLPHSLPYTRLSDHLNQAAESFVYPVERQYLGIALRGSALPTLLRQTCNVNFQALALEEQPVLMTMMTGVSVTIIPGAINGIPFYQVWGDRSYGVYLWQTLWGIVQELGGAIVGINQMLKNRA